MSFSKQTLIKGTLLLTLAGFATRFLGFFYRIYLANLLGATLLGRYQLVFPIYAVCFTIYGAGLQTAISQIIATENGKKHPHSKLSGLVTGILLGQLLAGILQFILYHYADWIAIHFAMEPSLAPCLKILSRLLPFCSLSACINGYYYGIQSAGVPAAAQIIEQLARIIFVWLIQAFLLTQGSPEDYCLLAVWGLVAGEVAGCLYNLSRLLHDLRYSKRQGITRSNQRIFQTATDEFSRKNNYKRNSIKYQASKATADSFRKNSHRLHTTALGELLWLAGTLTLTRLFVTLLNSMEAFLLPAMLRRYGLSPEEALSCYGIMTGMSLSFLLFPSTITNSLVVLLTPSIAQAKAGKRNLFIRQSISASIKYCLLLGILCSSIFYFFGKEMCIIFFHNAKAGNYLVRLSSLCPLLYLSTALTGIINGLKKNQITFLITGSSIGIKIAFLLFGVPRYGMNAYIVGMLCSLFIQVSLSMIYLFRTVRKQTVQERISKQYRILPLQHILFPILLSILSGSIIKSSHNWFCSRFHILPVFYLIIAIVFLSLIYLGYLLLLQQKKPASAKKLLRNQ